MSRDGSGNYSLAEAAFVDGTTIEAAKVNSNFNDIASALTASLAKDGQTVPTANQPMGGYRHTGVGNASARTHYAAAGQVADNSLAYAVDTGTADVYAIAPSPGITAYAVGQRFTFKVINANTTTTPTLNVNSVGAGVIKWPNGDALQAGDLPANSLVEVVVSATTPVFHLQTVARGGTAVTQSYANNSTKYATTAYVDRVGIQQFVSAPYGSPATGTTVIPVDNTIPQNTEGDQYMSLTLTPKSATSTLLIEVTFYGALSIAGAVTVALFQDSTANALNAAAGWNPDINTPRLITLRHTMTSGTVSPTTFKVRAGPNSAATLTFNGAGGSGLFGLVFTSSITVTEIGV